ncbi:hypothetical protein [Thiomicrospira microaerophila]|uniref:hypothetical protein n=1 Tax=Thiomicrospira microaerophila TaxID=406020 RepID=UPI0005C97E19|nr:hypothetical protein [Thiomicrospira microaerophila]
MNKSSGFKKTTKKDSHFRACRGFSRFIKLKIEHKVESSGSRHKKSVGWRAKLGFMKYPGYVILDDFLGMGGTLASLKSFIEGAGAK